MPQVLIEDLILFCSLTILLQPKSMVKIVSFAPFQLQTHELYSLLKTSSSTGCSKSLAHILTLNMSKTIKEITMHLIYSKSLQSQVFHRMFKDVQCEHR